MEVARDNFVKTPFIYLAHSLPAVHYCCLKYFISQRTLLGPNDTAYGHVCCSAYRLLWQKSRIVTRYKKHRREGLLVCRYDNLCVVFFYIHPMQSLLFRMTTSTQCVCLFFLLIVHFMSQWMLMCVLSHVANITPISIIWVYFRSVLVPLLYRAFPYTMALQQKPRDECRVVSILHKRWREKTHRPNFSCSLWAYFLSLLYIVPYSLEIGSHENQQAIWSAKACVVLCIYHFNCKTQRGWSFRLESENLISTWGFATALIGNTRQISSPLCEVCWKQDFSAGV